ncbi:hypothetical protein QJS04_geneDACA022924 [Acorus gramineus]|uniref:Succinate dehydrogenase subunit 5, mitochondrial n=1 Tax=Acorus gramineus TaxID=55184 RepID=A0AAV8ZYY3_ACOGR|nr:hypothetical protein QJS04_geneDACA022924 [Acorus gramineus]
MRMLGQMLRRLSPSAAPTTRGFLSPHSSSSISRLTFSSSSLHCTIFSVAAPSTSASRDRVSSPDCRLPFAIGFRRLFSADTVQLPSISDDDVKRALKNLMAVSWDEIPDSVIPEAKKALSKETPDKAGQEALANVYRAAEAVEEFSGVLVSLRMDLDDRMGATGAKVQPLPDEVTDALNTAYKRYMAYLDSFSPDESYLRKKVEVELGTKMIHLKMRCSAPGHEWGKVTVLGTSGLAGSYVEHRA